MGDDMTVGEMSTISGEGAVETTAQSEEISPETTPVAESGTDPPDNGAEGPDSGSEPETTITAAPEDDFETRIKESDLYRELELRAAKSEEENHSLRMQQEQNNTEKALAAAADQSMRQDLEAIRAIDPSVQSLESIPGYAELAARGITGTDAYYILQGQEAVGKREELAIQRIRQEMQEDLKAIQGIDPRVQSLEEISGYAELAARGITGTDAYFIAKGMAALKAEMTPPPVGAVGSLGEIDVELDPAVLDRLTQRELLEDPNLYAKAMRALAKVKSNNQQ